MSNRIVEGMGELRKVPNTAPYTADETAALQELEDFLKPRIEAVYRGEFSEMSVMEIFENAIASKKL
jgi:hypothetical protein